MKQLFENWRKHLNEQQEIDEESIYNKYWKAAVEDAHADQANEYYDDYNPESEERLVSKRVGFAYSRIRHAMGQYGGTPVTSDQEIIKAIQDGWEEGEEEYYDSEEY